MHIPRYKLPRYRLFNITEQCQIHVMKVASFLKWVVNRDKLEIANYFEVSDVLYRLEKKLWK